VIEEEQKYCYLVDHPKWGTKVFYNRYEDDKPAKLAVDYAENLCTVFKMPLHEEAVSNLSTEFNYVVKAIELPSIPVEAILSSVG